jgi:hypothetical protein
VDLLGDAVDHEHGHSAIGAPHAHLRVAPSAAYVRLRVVPMASQFPGEGTL